MVTIQNERFNMLLVSWPEKAIRFIYESYYDNLVLISQHHTQDLIASEDIVQEVYADIWDDPKKFSCQKEESIEYYLLRRVKNKSILAGERKFKAEQALIRASWDQSDFPTDNDIIALEQSTCLRIIVNTFSAGDKTCFQLRYRDRMTVEQVAANMKTSTRHIEKILNRMRRKLRDYQWALR